VKKKYSVAEINSLRSACEQIYLFGTPLLQPKGGFSRSFKESDKITAVEEMCRTYMTAGITADDLCKAYAPQQEEKASE